MFRTLLLMLFLCGLTAVSVVTEYRARVSETYICPSPPLPRVCVPEVKHNCEVAARPRACEPMKRQGMDAQVISCCVHSFAAVVS